MTQADGEPNARPGWSDRDSDNEESCPNEAWVREDCTSESVNGQWRVSPLGRARHHLRPVHPIVTVQITSGGPWVMGCHLLLNG